MALSRTDLKATSLVHKEPNGKTLCSGHVRRLCAIATSMARSREACEFKPDHYVNRARNNSRSQTGPRPVVLDRK